MKSTTLLVGLVATSALGAAAYASLYAANATASTAKGGKVTFTKQESEASVSGYDGKVVVLEWFNDGCPYVKKHYNSGNMQAVQKKYTGKGVVWLTIVSSKPGAQGYVTAETGTAKGKDWKTSWSELVLDPSGDVGRLFGAKTTPHMVILDKKGTIVYDGAIDSIRSSDPADVTKAENYVAGALDAVLVGKPVPTPRTQPYGCSVKY